MVACVTTTYWQETTMTDTQHPSDLPPRLIAPPDAAHALATRAFQGIASLALSPRAFWATWYAGPTPNEDQNNYVVLSRSLDGGRYWVEQTVIDPDGDGPVRAFDPEIWVDPLGRLWWFWAQGLEHQGATARVWAMTREHPDAETPWSAPRLLARGVMMNKPLVLSNGEWVLPVSTWRECDASAGFVVSSDQGRTWSRRGGVDVPREARSYDEHSFIERADGTLACYVRTRYGIGCSQSADGGRNWSPLEPSGIPHPDARFFIRRLQSGNLLLVKHGPMTERTGRSHLTAFLSSDDGRTWQGGLLLDPREKVSYPDGQQAADGTIIIAYDCERVGAREIDWAGFREEDILSGDANAPRVRLRNRISASPSTR